jgi:hypothetical protein
MSNSADLKLDELTFAREIMAREIQYLREKEWKIFSWANTIQMGTIGGVITLVAVRGSVLSLHRFILGTVSIACTLIAFMWIKQILKREEDTLTILNKYDEGLMIQSSGWSIKAAQIGYLWTLVLFELAVLMTILYV